MEGGGSQSEKGDPPICSTMSVGKTRDAKARRKMSENSLSRPPMPMRSKFQSGLMMDCRDSRVLAFPVGAESGRMTRALELNVTQKAFKTFHSQNTPGN